MTDLPFGRLVDLPPREAWRNEERDFTPWLAQNLGQLAEVIGIPIEITGIEVSVDRFEADILARNPMDDTTILIENQLEVTDHGHLGQIMTYLAGLNAHTVVWIAPAFREPHLSAIRWLNEHTAEGFAFFAVKLRVVRIASSPFAPIFEVIEKPNGWERRLTANRQAKESMSDIGERRRAFWQAYLDRSPSAADWGLKVMGASSAWVPVPALVTEAYISLWIGASDCGAFLRGPRGGDQEALVAQLAPYAAELERETGATFAGSPSAFLWCRAGKGFAAPSDWPAIIDWMEGKRTLYLAALARIAQTAGHAPPAQTE